MRRTGAAHRAATRPPLSAPPRATRATGPTATRAVGDRYATGALPQETTVPLHTPIVLAPPPHESRPSRLVRTTAIELAVCSIALPAAKPNKARTLRAR